MGIDNLGSRKGRGDAENDSSRRLGAVRSPPRRRFKRGPRLPADFCNNCHHPGHFAWDCSNAALCNNCGLPGHTTSMCSNEPACWNCKEPGHNAHACPNEAVCRLCSRSGHVAKDCTSKGHIDTRLCNNCHRPGHLAVDCKNEKTSTIAANQGTWPKSAETAQFATLAIRRATLHVIASLLVLGQAAHSAFWTLLIVGTVTIWAISPESAWGHLFVKPAVVEVIRLGSAPLIL